MKVLWGLEACGGDHCPRHLGGFGGGQGAPSLKAQTHSSKGTPPPEGRQNALTFPIPRQHGAHSFTHSPSSLGHPPPVTVTSHPLTVCMHTQHAHNFNVNKCETQLINKP